MRERKKLLHVLLCFLLLTSLMYHTVMRVNAEHERNETKRAISVVFDNSGSMYLGDSNQCKAWCRATYSMEVFAAMMNPGDILEIYPMAAIEVRGNTYTDTNPLIIDSSDKVSMIRDIFTPLASNTPIETITAAYNGLQKYSDRERWLIVLTDGETFYQDGSEISDTKAALSQKLSEYNQEINVMYLGIGPVAVEPDIEGRFSHVSNKAADTGDVLAKLTAMCNMIFGRDALPDAGASLSFDLPMSKIIIFAQGKDIADISLKNMSGDSAEAVKEYAPRFSELGAGNYCPCVVDTSLQGVVTTYQNCPAGDYTIHYTGTVSNISVYYEPDVDLTAFLTDEDDAPVSGELYSGSYYIRYGIVNDKGEFISSPLLGKTEYEITYTINGEAKTVNASEAGKAQIEVSAGDKLDVHAEVTYLSGYHIERNGSEMGWPKNGYTIAARPAGKLKLKLDKGLESCKLSELEQKGIFDFRLVYEDLPLTGKALDTADIKPVAEGGKLCCDKVKTADGFLLKLCYDGSADNTTCGDYNIKVSATYVNEEGQTAVSNTVSLPFRIEDDRYTLQMELDVPQSFYQISKIDRGKPVQANITYDQTPLTDTELKKIKFTVNADGLPVMVSPLPGKSAFEIRLDPEGEYQQGFYSITCKVSGEDVFGKYQEAEKSKNIELRRYPIWLRWLLVLLIIGLIISAILWYLNTKVLPKGISVRDGSTNFTVNGSHVAGKASCTYTGRNKRNGSLKISMPKYSADPLVKGGFTLDLSAVSPRKTKSSGRRAGATSLNRSGPAIKNVQVSNITYAANEDGRFAKVGAVKVDMPSDGHRKSVVMFSIGNNANCVIAGETVTGTTFSCTLNLRFN